jgi:hypothetical protein
MVTMCWLSVLSLYWKAVALATPEVEGSGAVSVCRSTVTAPLLVTRNAQIGTSLPTAAIT